MQRKADNYYRLGEWPYASALYDLMLQQRPRVADTYGRAVISLAMQGDTAGTSNLLAQAMDHAVPYDSVMYSVHRQALAQGRAELYPQFLLRARDRFPWMSRAVDRYLLNYYLSRHDAELTAHYARKLLNGLPDDIPLNLTLARSLLQQGKETEAISVYEQILRLEPDNADALLELGVYFRTKNDPRADSFLNKLPRR